MTVILVHPGSLIAAKSESGFQDFDGMREELLSCPPENRFLITGGLIPEDEYRITRELADLAKAANPPIEAGPEGRALARAAKQIWKALPADRKRGQILVTGAWADPEDGCATAVHNTLLDLGAHSTLSELSPIFGEEDEETEEP